MPNPLQIEPEFAPSYDLWKADPGPAGSASMLTAVKPVIDTAVKTYGGLSSGPTIRSHAKRIVLDSLPKYDGNKGKLKPFLMSHLQGLRRIAGDETATIHIPERIRLDHNLLTKATNDMRDDLGRPPSDGELAEQTGISIARIGKVRHAAIPAVGEGYEHVTAKPIGHHDTTWHDFVYHTLRPEDQLIMEYSHGMRQRPVLGTAEIAQLMRVTPAAISQRKKRIQDLLDQSQSMS